MAPKLLTVHWSGQLQDMARFAEPHDLKPAPSPRRYESAS